MDPISRPSDTPPSLNEHRRGPTAHAVAVPGRRKLRDLDWDVLFPVLFVASLLLLYALAYIIGTATGRAPTPLRF